VVEEEGFDEGRKEGNQEKQNLSIGGKIEVLADR
jgi:hypothetical protein